MKTKVCLLNKLFPLIVIFLSTECFSQTSLIVNDTRSQSSSPSSYSSSFEAHFKYGSAINLPEISNPYYTILGFRGWTEDNSGGKAHELAFSNDGKIFFRSGYSPSWESWKSLVVENELGNVGIGTTNPGAKLSFSELTSDN